VTPADFEQASHHELAKLLFAALRSEDMDPLPHIKSTITEELQPLLDELLKPLGQKEPSESQLLDDLTRTLLSIRRLRVQMNIDQVRFMANDPDTQDTGLNYDDLFIQLTQTRSRLDKALALPFQFG